MEVFAAFLLGMVLQVWLNKLENIYLNRQITRSKCKKIDPRLGN